MIIGHNPYLTEFLKIIDPTSFPIFPTASIVILQVNASNWSNLTFKDLHVELQIIP